MAGSVFFFVPNIIGYVRIALVIASLLYIRAPLAFFVLYSLSCLLDVADGYAARYFDQCTLFGAVLDMVTDRSTTACLLAYLCTIYPQWAVTFQLLTALDISSHYMHMYASLQGGGQSHKTVRADANFLLRLYYTSRLVLFAACALNEAFFLSLYMASEAGKIVQGSPGSGSAFMAVFADTAIWRWAVVVCAPVFLFKQAMNVIQLLNATFALAKVDASSRLPKQALAKKIS